MFSLNYDAPVNTPRTGRSASRTRFLAAIGLTLCVGPLAAGQPAPAATLTTALRAHLKDERFGVVTSVRGLPLGVREALQSLFGGSWLEIAEPGAEFQATDVIVNPKLPRRRLVTAGCSADHCLVYYERGGFVHTWHVALLHWTPEATRVEWGGSAPGGLASVGEVQNAILSGKVSSPAKDW